MRLAEEEKADVFVPVTSPVASAYEARLNAALPAHCFSWSLPPDEVEALDDKVRIRRCGMLHPLTLLRPLTLSPPLTSLCPHTSPPPLTSPPHSPQVIYCRSAESLGLPVPVAHRVSSHAEVVAWNEKFAALAAAEPDAKHPR